MSHQLIATKRHRPERLTTEGAIRNYRWFFAWDSVGSTSSRIELQEFNIEHVVPLCSPRHKEKRADRSLRGLRRRLEHFILWLAAFAHGSLGSNFYGKRKTERDLD